MNKKKFVSVGIFAVAIAIGAGVAYYCYPSAINNALGINNVGVNTISDGDLLAADNGVSSSLTGIDPDAGSDDAATNASVAPAPALAPSPSSAKKSVANARSGVASTPAVENDDNSSDSVIAQTSSSPSFSASSSITATLSAVPCVFPASAPASSTTREIILNEIAWMGSSLSSTAEWMEIKNISPVAVSLSGWGLLDASGKLKISFTGRDGALAPGGLLLLSRGTTTPAGVVGATKTYSGDLANTGDTLALMDPQCDVSDYLDASGGWPAGNNTTKQTLERDTNGIGWHTSAQPGGTPGAENSTGPVATMTPSITPISTSTPAPTPTSVSTPPPPQNIALTENTSEDISMSSDSDVTTSTSTTTSNTQSTTTATTSTDSGSDSDNAASVDDSAVSTTVAPATIVASGHALIAAVQIAGASSSNDLVKLYNPTAATIDMSGWKLRKKSSTGTDYSLKVFPAGSVIGAGQSFVWANSDGGFSEAVSANVSSTETLAADNSVALMDAAGNIVDAVAWGTGTSQYGEGPPYPTSPGANQLLSRRSSDGVMADTDNNSNDFTLQ